MKFIDYPQAIHPERLAAAEFLEHNAYRGRVVLDLGCGRHKTLPDIIGIDLRPSPALPHLLADVTALPIDFGTVDLMVCRHVFEHLLDPILALRHWSTLLTAGGRIFFVLPDHAAINTMDPMYSGPTFEHLHAYTRESFARLVEEVGDFSVVGCGPLIDRWSFYLEAEAC